MDEMLDTSAHLHGHREVHRRNTTITQEARDILHTNEETIKLTMIFVVNKELLWVGVGTLGMVRRAGQFGPTFYTTWVLQR
jgi:hypothetical protein